MALSTESVSGALDNSTSIGTPPPLLDESTGELKSVYDPLLKWQMQSVARLALGSQHRIRICCRHIRSDWREVQVRGAPGRRPYYAGLMACGSVWCCPVCAAKIQSVRAAEVRAAVDAWAARGGSVLLATLTVPHTRHDDLSALLSRFNESVRCLMRGKPWQRLKAAYGLSGYVKGLEVTYGDTNGWHPHAHVLLFLETPVQLDALASDLFRRWQSATARAGFGEVSPAAFSLQDGSAVRNYITKLGSEYVWGAEHELVKSHTKRGGLSHFTPFDLLRAYLDNPDDGRLLALFAEFANVFRGRNQLTWARGFKRSLLGAFDPSDQEIADSVGELDPILAYIALEDWRLIRKHDLRGEVLQLVAEFGQAGVDNLLAGLRGDEPDKSEAHSDVKRFVRGFSRDSVPTEDLWRPPKGRKRSAPSVALSP